MRDNRLAQRAVMLPTKNMIIVECLDDDGPPDTGADDFELNPRDRYCQLGGSATACVLDGTVRALKFTENGVLVIDVGPKIGDSARSVLSMLPTMNAPVYYCAIGAPEEVRILPKPWRNTFVGGVLEDCGFRALVCGA